MVGVAGVGIAPEHRGGGTATEMMRETVRTLRADGFPISTLYPATQTVYRRVGYERAGLDVRHEMPTKAIDVRERGTPVRRATDADVPAIEACARRRAAATNGNLDRGPYIWQRIRDGRSGRAHCYVAEEGGEVTGYVYYVHRQSPDFAPDLLCTDLCATTPAAARRLLAFFGDHRSLSGKLLWTGAPNDVFVFHLREQAQVDHEINFTWMLRVLDVPAALAARGWPAGLATELHLDVADDVIDENRGRWLVRIADGRATAERGGRGDLRLDVRGLAALYTSYASAGELAASGLAEGTPAAFAAAGAAFAGPTPWLADFF
jgi:predicted acetyltransferase